jgi:hypothetical protein
MCGKRVMKQNKQNKKNFDIWEIDKLLVKTSFFSDVKKLICGRAIIAHRCLFEDTVHLFDKKTVQIIIRFLTSFNGLYSLKTDLCGV